MIINASLNEVEIEKLFRKLRLHRKVIEYTIVDNKEIILSICMYRTLLENDYKTSIEHQRRSNHNMKVIKKEVLKLLDVGVIYLIFDSEWVSPIQVVPKKGGMTIIKNEKNELIPTRIVTGWRMCIDYRKLNREIRKDHFPLPFIDRMLKRLAKHSYIFFIWMDILVSIKSPYILVTKKRLDVLVPMVLLLTEEYLSVFVTPPRLSNFTRHQSFLTR